MHKSGSKGIFQKREGGVCAAPFWIVTSVIALLIAVPVSFGIALFLTELAPNWLKRPLGIAIELLAAIPSVVYGLWAIFELVPLMRQHVQPFLGKYLGFLPFFQGPNYGLGML